MKRRLSLLALFGVVILGGWTKPAFSQIGASASQLNGAVRDESGGSVPKANISVRETETNRTYTAVTNDNGLYILPNLPPGLYEMTTEAPAFAKSTQKGIVLTVGQVATIDVVVKVASGTENLVVTTDTPAVEPTRTEVSQVINTNQIQSLPISGRLFTDFALLTPGVATGRTSLQSTITETEVTRISFGGMRDLSNMVTVDGADTINTATGSQRATPSQEAVTEFRVVNNGFGAEQGRALGGIVNIITKSGTNDLHGSVYDYLQNNVTNARSLLKPSTVANPQPNTLRQNQYGATLGGPIKKDKTFFFMNFEGQRRAEAPSYPTILINNLALINNAKALLGIAPEDLNILKTGDSDRGLIKIDHQLNNDHRLSLRYNVEDARNSNVLVGETLDGGGIGAPSSGHNNYLRDQSLVGILSSQLKTNLINTALVQYARRHSTFPGVTGQPNLDLPNSLLMGHNFGVFDATYESRLQISDSVFWVKGAHLVKFGVDYNYLNDHIIWPGFSPMRIVLPGVNCLVDFANHVEQAKNPAFVPGNPNFLTSNFAEGPCPMALPPSGNPGLNFPPSPFPSAAGPNPADPANGIAVILWPSPVGTADNSVVNGTIPPPVNTNWQAAYPADQTKNYFSDINHSYYGFFAQDQWRLTPKLTINYGIRWDFEKGLEKQIHDNYKGFQPRVGFAYSPDKHTVIRAGFGIFDDRYNLSFLFVTFPQRPIALAGVNLPDLRQGAFNATYALSQLPFVPGILNPTQVATNLVVNGTYPAVSLITDLSKGLVSSVGDGTVEANSKIPYSEQSSLEIDREIGKGLVLNVGYLFVSSHHQVRAENLNVCPVGGVATGPYPCPAAPPKLPGYPAGKDNFSGPRWLAGLIYSTDNSGNSVYHGVTFSASEHAGHYLQFQANYTFSKTLDDGTFTTFVSTPENLYNRALERANSNQDIRHRFVANFTASAPEKSFARYFGLSGIVTLESPRPFTMFVGFDANGDTNPVTDRVGSSPRNTYWGDNLRTVDLRLSRYFKFRERQKIELAVDAFNAFNRANVNEVTSVYGTYNFCGSIPHNYKDTASIAVQTGQANCAAAGVVAGPPVPNPGFGGPRTMFNPRQFQFSLKYSF